VDWLSTRRLPIGSGDDVTSNATLGFEAAAAGVGGVESGLVKIL
jgi:hypothetical protein